jgi:hypothetical protein
MGKHRTSVDSAIQHRLNENGRGWVFTPAQLSELGSRDAVASALKRYKASGAIRQIAWGLYDYPVVDSVFGVVPPTVERVVAAIAARDAVRVQPGGAMAANALGLSTQVPAKLVYLTDGRSQRIVIGRNEIILKHTSPRCMASAGRVSGLVFEALRFFGKERVTNDMIHTLQRRLHNDDIQQIQRDIVHAPVWMARALKPLLSSLADA